MDKTELTELLSTPLDPDLDYVDATKALEVLGEHVRGLHKLIGYMFEALTTQGRAILDIREKMVEHKGAIELIANHVMPEDDRPGLIGFEEPAIVIPRKH